jgi:hypothetical protein
LWIEIFTTTIIVNRRIVANIINVGILCSVYRILVCFTYTEFIEKFISDIDEININIIVDEDRVEITMRAGRVWFGVIATKYENITNIPPM